MNSDPALDLSTARPAAHRRPDQGETVSANGVRYTFTLGGADTAGAYELMEVTVSPGLGPPTHMHAGYEESFTVLDGELTLQCGGEMIHATVGSCVNIPRGAVHAFKNTGSAPARILTLMVPAGLEAYFRAAAHPVADGPGVPLAPTPEDGQRLLALGAAYGIEFVGPHPNPVA